MALANRSNARRHRKPSVSRLTRSSKQRKKQNCRRCFRNGRLLEKLLFYYEQYSSSL